MEFHAWHWFFLGFGSFPLLIMSILWIADRIMARKIDRARREAFEEHRTACARRMVELEPQIVKNGFAPTLTKEYLDSNWPGGSYDFWCRV